MVLEREGGRERNDGADLSINHTPKSMSQAPVSRVRGDVKIQTRETGDGRGMRKERKILICVYLVLRSSTQISLCSLA